MRAASLAALALALALAACGGPQGGTGSSGDFALPDVRGRTVHLSDYRGKVVLLDFWATWCTPCAGEMPHLQRIYETYRERGFVVLGVAMDGPESVANVAPLARRYGVTFPVLLDEETRVTATWNPKRAAPFAVLLDRDGTVRWTHEGYTPGDEAALEEEVKAAVHLDAP